jgi:hypothetical protein
MNRLHAKGWISDPVSKAKSVLLTEEGRKRAETLVERHLRSSGLKEESPPGMAGVCACGCGKSPEGGTFLPGHDQKLRAALEARVGGVLSMRTLVAAAESYAKGQRTADDLGRVVREILAP